MQHRAEDLALQRADVVDLNHRRRHEGAAAQCIGVHRRRPRHAVAFAAHGGNVALDDALRVAVDHRPHIHRQAARVADAQFAHRAFEHLDQPVSAVALHAQHAQGRAALPGAVEGRGHHVGHHLLGER